MGGIWLRRHLWAASALLLPTALSCEVVVQPVRDFGDGTTGGLGGSYESGGSGGSDAGGSSCTEPADCSGGQLCDDDQCRPAESCQQLHRERGELPNGAYLVQAPGADSRTVYCDMLEDGGGWMLVSEDMVAKQDSQNTTVEISADEDGGLILSAYANTGGCSDESQSCHSLLLAEEFTWTEIRARYSFAGDAACYSILGDTKWGGQCVGASLLPFDPALDPIRDEYRMGLNLTDEFLGPVTKCDQEPSFWAADNGTLHFVTVLLRRSSEQTAGGLYTGVSCNSFGPGAESPTFWRYERIFIR